MNSILVYALYTLSLLLTLIPLLLILLTKTIRLYFVYFIAVSGFLFLNLIGSLSSRIEPKMPEYYAVYFFVSIIFFLFFLILVQIRRRFVKRTLSTEKASNTEFPGFRIYVIILFTIACISVLLCSLLLSPPLLLRFDLYGQWNVLVDERVSIVLSPKFHWYALGMFEVPLFLVVLAFSAYAGRKRLQLNIPPRFRHGIFSIVAASILFSLLLLNKQYVMYLFASLVFIVAIYSKRLPLVRIAIAVFGSFVLLMLLYIVYMGVDSLPYLSGIIIHRIFEVYPLAAAIMFRIFPAQHPFLDGTSVVNLFGLFPYTPVSVADMIYPYIYGNTGYGSAPLPALFENYANWGWAGIVWGTAIICGVILAGTLLSWTSNFFHFSVAVYIGVKTILFWQAPFWFGTLEPTLIFMIAMLYVLYFFITWLHKFFRGARFK
ncbi:hypothetical protein QWJ34_19800 [Saccharibacillus sp. CPCC 101409]|uniref:hypothetical protein n=1 Tax=Saccharibacillus sp. CPCC 101409 TaxID=3058041 RepID=UPI002670EF41|nr:hypothetical protein [Saccharibacillus sp. CPCC 101409]MDO3412016.1 hypothetical protein [Saccharibacillus sp. CPCC 101409]